MSEQEKKRQRICHLLDAEAKPKSLCQLYIKQRNFFYRKRVFKGKDVVENWTPPKTPKNQNKKNEKKAFKLLLRRRLRTPQQQ